MLMYIHFYSILNYIYIWVNISHIHRCDIKKVSTLNIVLNNIGYMVSILYIYGLRDRRVRKKQQKLKSKIL